MKKVVTVIGLIFSLAASSFTQAVEPADLDLVKIKETRTSVAYLKADQDFSHFDKIAIAEIDTANVKVNEPTDSPVHRNDWTMDEERQSRVKTMHQKAFDREFADAGHLELVDTVDEDTLVLVTKLSEVSPTVGYDSQMIGGRSRVYSAGAGSAVIEMYLVDGGTGEVVAVAASGRALGNGFVQTNNSVTNGSDVQMAFNIWASQALDAIENLPELAAEAG